MGGPIFNSAFNSYEDEANGQGKRPVVFDILGPDRETSILPESMKLVLHVNPSSMNFSYTMVVERIQTLGGWVEQHWGSAVDTISFEQATGGFMRLYSGLSNVTGGPGAVDLGGTRRESIAYDKFLDLLALFHNNARIYGRDNKIAFQGIIKISFDGQSWFGWFNDFSWTESAEKPYQFDVTTSFSIDSEEMTSRTVLSQTAELQTFNATTLTTASAGSAAGEGAVGIGGGGAGAAGVGVGVGGDTGGVGVGGFDTGEGGQWLV